MSQYKQKVDNSQTVSNNVHCINSITMKVKLPANIKQQHIIKNSKCTCTVHVGHDKWLKKTLHQNKFGMWLKVAQFD